MANVIRTQFQGKDGRLNIDKGILTLYGGPTILRLDITLQENTEALREFLSVALARGQGRSFSLFHETNKNTFKWDPNGLSRMNHTNGAFSWLLPKANFTKKILSAMVRANVKTNVR